MIRRDLLIFGGGATAGIVFTPTPWRLLGDVAMWSQNWSWMPRAPRGELSDKEARCTLCPGGCAVRARMVGATPQSLWPRGSALCPAGFVAHHLIWHPLRLRHTLHQGHATSVDDALKAVAARSGKLAVLDLQPGRTASLLHRLHLAKLNGLYLTPPPVEGSTAQAVATLLERPARVAPQLAETKTVLSVSTPLLDGWAMPARSARPNRAFRLIQADARRSRTAGLADTHLAIRPGSETALLLALARILLESTSPKLEGLDTLRRAAEPFTPAEAAQLTGLKPEEITVTAQALPEPSLILADGDPVGGPLRGEARAVAAALNVLTGLKGFAAQADVPAPKEWSGVAETPLASVADGSISTLILDEPAPGLGLPWALIAPKLAPGAAVVALTWNRVNFAVRTTWMVPVPVAFEIAQDAPPPYDTARAAYATSPALVAPPAGVIHAADFVAHLAGDETSFADRLAERTKAVGAEAKDYDPLSAPHPTRVLPASVTADQLITAARQPHEGLQVVAHGWRQAAVSPMLGKLWQESELKDAPRDAAMNPATLHHLNLAEGRDAHIMADSGGMLVHIESDPALAPDTVALSSGPAWSELCSPDDGDAWTVPTVKVRPA